MQTIARLDGLPGLVSGWEALAASSAVLPMQDAPWALAAAEAFDDPLHVVVHGDPSAPEAIAPMARRGRELELLGSAQIHEPTDLLARSPEALGVLARELLRARQPISLRRIPADSDTVAALRDVVGRRGVVRVQEGAGHPALTLTEAWHEPGGGLSSSRRSSLRRARRRAEQSGEVTAELLTPTPEAVGELLDVAFDVEARSWKGRAGTALAMVPEIGDFYRRYAARMAERGALRVDLLRIDGAAVAVQIGVEWRNRVWLLKIGYDEDHAAASPGQLLLAESIADAARRGCERYEFLGSAAPWTEVWAPELASCTSVVAYPPGLASAVSLTGVVRRSLAGRALDAARTARGAAEERAARRFVAGPALEDALREQRRYADAGYLTTVGFWHGLKDNAATVAQGYRDALEALPAGSELSIKPPALGNDAKTVAALLERARERGVGLHFDALQPPTAPPVLALAAQLAPSAEDALGCTLTGRWQRSVADAELVVEHGLRVRIVKSEWEDPDEPYRNPRAGYLEVVDALAGRAAHVEVATQDAKLAREALDRLLAAGTSCELQVLHAMPTRRVIAEARSRNVPVRVYVPYGSSRLPFELDELYRHPLRLLRLLALAVGSLPGSGPPR